MLYNQVKDTDHDFFITFRSKEIYIYFKTYNRIPIDLLK